mmetsp:Transcript_100483/g.324274  ORF Transcript_100483/g.324274 Transcript_100483/m.324274 type:complete len:444 (-) Transcript_100483:177-1508(-)
MPLPSSSTLARRLQPLKFSESSCKHLRCARPRPTSSALARPLQPQRSSESVVSAGSCARPRPKPSTLASSAQWPSFTVSPRSALGGCPSSPRDASPSQPSRQSVSVSRAAWQARPSPSPSMPGRPGQPQKSKQTARSCGGSAPASAARCPVPRHRQPARRSTASPQCVCCRNGSSAGASREAEPGSPASTAARHSARHALRSSMALACRLLVRARPHARRRAGMAPRRPLRRLGALSLAFLCSCWGVLYRSLGLTFGSSRPSAALRAATWHGAPGPGSARAAAREPAVVPLELREERGLNEERRKALGVERWEREVFEEGEAFDMDYTEHTSVFLESGKVEVEVDPGILECFEGRVPDAAEPGEHCETTLKQFSAGDLAVFSRGIGCQWRVLERTVLRRREEKDYERLAEVKTRAALQQVVDGEARKRDFVRSRGIRWRRRLR